MTGFRILGDDAVRQLLIGLPANDIRKMQDTIQEALRQFSVSNEKNFQPEAGIINRPAGQKVLFRAFTSPSAVGTKIIVDPAPDPKTGRRPPLHGVLMICDNSGIPVGLIGAEEVTGFRTALSAIVPWSWRKCVENVVVFGAGKQALYHIRIALALRGEEIKTVTVVNRTAERSAELIKRIQEENDLHWHSKAELVVCDAADTEAVDARLAEADVVFCTVPSQQVLFRIDSLKLGSRSQMPFISAIGSWQPQMIELDPELLKRVSSESDEARVLVDDRKAFQHHTGEGQRSGLGADEVYELGEVIQMHSDTGFPEDRRSKLNEWLSTGLVVYKSVGVSLTDLAIGEAILSNAQAANMGTVVPSL